MLISDFSKNASELSKDSKKLSLYYKSFPRSESSYIKCVNDFVSVGKNSPKAAINVLLSLLPERKDNKLYQIITSITNCYSDGKKALYDLILYIFFADCTVQILTVLDDNEIPEYLIDLGYILIKPFSNQNEMPLRLQIVNQFSVILSLYSKVPSHLAEILDDFTLKYQSANPALFFSYHRFVRFNVSDTVSIDKICNFLDNFAESFLKIKVDQEVEAISAKALCSLISQLSSEDYAALSNPIEKIFKAAYKKCYKDKHVNHLALCATLIHRDRNLNLNNYETFLHELLKKSQKYLERTLDAFLIILRGKHFSKSTFYWEWGKFNKFGHPGVEATHIYLPDQNQSEENSFTQLFLKYFVPLSIEKYSSTTGDILLNLAARDFKYFIQSTVPRFIKEMKDFRAALPLQACLEKIIDPKNNFVEWIQQNPRNQYENLNDDLTMLFMSTKQIIFAAEEKISSKTLTSEVFSFTLTDSREIPILSLPIEMKQQSINFKKRLNKNNQTIKNVLDDWKFNDKSNKNSLNCTSITKITKLTKQENKQLKLLGFYPRIINSSDMKNQSLCQTLLDRILSSSKAISIFSINILNQIFASNEDVRLIIYSNIFEKLSNTTNNIHIFMLLQFLVKLLDLSLAPKAENKDIKQFLLNTQPIVLDLFANPYPEIRDLVIILIERLNVLGLLLSIEIPFYYQIDTKAPVIAAAVRFKIFASLNDISINKVKVPDSFITLREAAVSQYNELFNYFLIEIATLFSQNISTRNLIETLNLFIKKYFDSSSFTLESCIELRSHFLVCSHLFRVPETPKLLDSPLSQRVTLFYNLPILHKIPEKYDEVMKKLLNNYASILGATLNLFINDPKDSHLLEKIHDCLGIIKNMNSITMSSFIPILLKWIDEKVKITSFYMQIIVDIFYNFSKNIDLEVGIIAYPNTKQGFRRFFDICENYFIEQKMNETTITKISSDLKNEDLIIHYCYALSNFCSGFLFLRPDNSRGAIRATIKEDNMIQEKDWPLTKRQNALIFLVNWHQLKSKYKSLAEATASAISSLIKIGPIFTQKFQRNETIIDTLISCESMNYFVLSDCLLHHLEFFSHDLDEAFNISNEKASYYFNGICYLFFSEPDNSLFNKFGFQETTETFRISTIRNIKSIQQQTSNNTLQTRLTISNEVPLTKKDIEINELLFKNAAKLISYSFLYLIHNNFNLRCTSFSFLLRIMPVLHTILYNKDQSHSEKAAKFISKLQVFGPIFYSSYVNISHESVSKICSLIIEFFPCLSDLILHEFIHFESTNKLLLQYGKHFIQFQRLTEFKNKQIWPNQFIYFTPNTFMKELILMKKIVNCSDLDSYLSIWETLSEGIENYKYVIDFIIDPRSSIEDEIGKIILVHLAKINPEIMIEKLAQSLSFSSWFYSTYKNQNEIPVSKPVSHTYIAIQTLTELIQSYFDIIIKYFQYILTFSLLFYDSNKQFRNLTSELLLVFFATIPNCPQSIISIFYPPYSLIWSNDLQPANEIQQDFTSTEISLQPFEKPTVSIVLFVRQFLQLYKDNKEVISQFGSELLKWICGCGDLFYASRAAFIFAEIMEPFNDNILKSLINSFSFVSSLTEYGLNLSKNNNIVNFYSIAMFGIFSSSFDKYGSIKEFKNSFQTIFMLSRIFLSCPDENAICQAAITNVAKFINYQHCGSSDIIRLLSIISNLFSNLNPQNTLYGLILSIFRSQIDKENSKVSQIAFILFLPTIYIALSVIHNIPPYSTDWKESDIINIFQTLRLISTTPFCSIEMQQFLNDVSNYPSSFDPDSFVLRISLFITQSFNFENINKGISILSSVASNSTNSYLDAILAIFDGILEINENNSLETVKFSSIAVIAAQRLSQQAERFLRLYLTKIPQNTSVDQQDTKNTKNMSKDISQKIKDNIKKIDFPTGETELNELLIPIPFTNNLWNHNDVQSVRDNVYNITVLPYSRTAEHIDKISNLSTNVSKIDSIVVPSDSTEYILYEKYL